MDVGLPTNRGLEIVNKQGLMFSLLAFVPDHILIKLQMINRRCYYVILPLAIKIVRIPKFVKPFELMGQDIDPKKVGCKRLQAIFIEGKMGDYFGEYDLLS